MMIGAVVGSGSVVSGSVVSGSTVSVGTSVSSVTLVLSGSAVSVTGSVLSAADSVSAFVVAGSVVSAGAAGVLPFISLGRKKTQTSTFSRITAAAAWNFHCL
jgi:hypothetical protein